MKTVHKELQDLISPEGKTIVITGAASSIGRVSQYAAHRQERYTGFGRYE